jgi:hypothetical protein
MSNSNPDLDTKVDDNTHKLVIKLRIRMIKTQVNWYTKTLVFLDLEANLSLVCNPSLPLIILIWSISKQYKG